jgi:hypothetical protein
VAERFANGEAFSTERIEAEAAARRAHHIATEQHVGPAHVALFTVQLRLDFHDIKFHVAVNSVRLAITNPSENREGCDRFAHHIRDIFGNPFRPVTFLPEWRTDTAVSLARTMYESRDFSAMPILADALQDAGCDNADVLDHCRGPGPHVRGCWVVDLLLGKA